jgi:hypothetical protein
LLWDDGISYSDDGRRLTEQYTIVDRYETEKVVREQVYKVVRPCSECRRGWTPPDSR